MPRNKTAPMNALPPIALFCELITINKVVALHLLRSTQFLRQRTLSQRNIDRLAGEMRRGWYVPATPLTFAVLPDRSMLLLNGQHSLNAVAQADVTIQFTAIKLPVASLEEAGHIYARLDIHRARTWHDAYKASGFEDKATFNSAWVNAFGAATRVLLSGFRAGEGYDNNDIADMMRSREIQLRIFDTYLPYAERFVAAMAYKEGRKGGIWRRAPVIAVGLETFRYQGARAHEFWHGASEDNGLRKGDPRKTLVEYLREISIMPHSMRRVVASAAALAWNAWLAGQSLTVLRPHTTGPMIIDGTPWTGAWNPLTEFSQLIDRPLLAVAYQSFATGQLITQREVIPITEHQAAAS